ncbi:ATP-binding protein, partial [Lacticaseibacillus rhamnosus]
MESTKGLFTHADVQKIIEKRGMDVSKLPTQAEIEQRFY